MTRADVKSRVDQLVTEAAACGLHLRPIAWMQRGLPTFLHFADRDAATGMARVLCGVPASPGAISSDRGACGLCVAAVRRAVTSRPEATERAIRQAYAEQAAGRDLLELCNSLSMTEAALLDHFAALGLGASGEPTSWPSRSEVDELRRERAKACLRCARELTPGAGLLSTAEYNRVRAHECPQWPMPRTVALTLGTEWRAAQILAGLTSRQS